MAMLTIRSAEECTKFYLFFSFHARNITFQFYLLNFGVGANDFEVNIYYWTLDVCVYVCVRASVRAGVRAFVCVFKQLYFVHKVQHIQNIIITQQCHYIRVTKHDLKNKRVNRIQRNSLSDGCGYCGINLLQNSNITTANLQLIHFK